MKTRKTISIADLSKSLSQQVDDMMERQVRQQRECEQRLKSIKDELSIAYRSLDKFIREYTHADPATNECDPDIQDRVFQAMNTIRKLNREENHFNSLIRQHDYGKERAKLTSLKHVCDCLLAARRSDAIAISSIGECVDDLRLEFAGGGESTSLACAHSDSMVADTLILTFEQVPCVRVPIVGGCPIYVRALPKSIPWLSLVCRTLNHDLKQKVYRPDELPLYFDESQRQFIVLQAISCLSSDQSLAGLVRNELAPSSGILDLSREYQSGSLAAILKARVIDAAARQARSAPKNVDRMRQDAASSIQSDWLAFVRAPWSSSLKGPVASLKYVLESGEVPRFWYEKLDNHYGFRIRTRDHSWLSGEVYVDVNADDAANPEQIQVHNGDMSPRVDEAVFTYGRLHVFIREERDAQPTARVYRD